MITWVVSLLTAPPHPEQVLPYTLDLGDIVERERPSLLTYLGLILYTLLILGVGYACNVYAG